MDMLEQQVLLIPNTLCCSLYKGWFQNRRLTGGSVWFRTVAIILNNGNHPEPDRTAGQQPVEFWSRP